MDYNGFANSMCVAGLKHTMDWLLVHGTVCLMLMSLGRVTRTHAFLCVEGLLKHCMCKLIAQATHSEDDALVHLAFWLVLSFSRACIQRMQHVLQQFNNTWRV